MNSRKGLIFILSIVFVGVFAVSVVHHLRTYRESAGSRSRDRYGQILPYLEKEKDYYAPDPVVGHVHRPYATRHFDWPEHPNGKIAMRTNNLGFREDEDTAPEKADGVYRILVTGDSHIDGVVENRESFPNRLEELLNSIRPGKRYEVINGGVGAFGPYQYLWFLEKYMYLEPDMFIVVFYIGNDFLNGIETGEKEKEAHVPKRPPAYYHRLQQMVSKYPHGICQVLNQIYLFKKYPRLVDPAVTIAVNQAVKIQQLCTQHGMEYVLLLLPTKFDIERGSCRGVVAMAREVLGLTDEDLALNQRMAKKFMAELKDHEVHYLDLTLAMHRSAESLFWEKDYHLNQYGHALVAKIFSKYFGGELE